MGIAVIIISNSGNDKLSSPLNFFLFRNMQEVKIQTMKCRVLIKCQQPAKKPDTWRLIELSTFGGNMVSRGSENLKLPKKHNWQAVYFNILAVNCKT